MVNIVVTPTILYMYNKLFHTEKTHINWIVKLLHQRTGIMRERIHFCMMLKTLFQLWNFVCHLEIEKSVSVSWRFQV